MAKETTQSKEKGMKEQTESQVEKLTLEDLLYQKFAYNPFEDRGSKSTQDVDWNKVLGEVEYDVKEDKINEEKVETMLRGIEADVKTLEDELNTSLSSIKQKRKFSFFSWLWPFSVKNNNKIILSTDEIKNINTLENKISEFNEKIETVAALKTILETDLQRSTPEKEQQTRRQQIGNANRSMKKAKKRLRAFRRKYVSPLVKNVTPVAFFDTTDNANKNVSFRVVLSGKIRNKEVGKMIWEAHNFATEHKENGIAIPVDTTTHVEALKKHVGSYLSVRLRGKEIKDLAKKHEERITTLEAKHQEIASLQTLLEADLKLLQLKNPSHKKSIEQRTQEIERIREIALEIQFEKTYSENLLQAIGERVHVSHFLNKYNPYHPVLDEVNEVNDKEMRKMLRKMPGVAKKALQKTISLSLIRTQGKEFVLTSFLSKFGKSLPESRDDIKTKITEALDARTKGINALKGEIREFTALQEILEADLQCLQLGYPSRKETKIQERTLQIQQIKQNITSWKEQRKALQIELQGLLTHLSVKDWLGKNDHNSFDDIYPEVKKTMLSSSSGEVMDLAVLRKIQEVNIDPTEHKLAKDFFEDRSQTINQKKIAYKAKVKQQFNDPKEGVELPSEKKHKERIADLDRRSEEYYAASKILEAERELLGLKLNYLSENSTLCQRIKAKRNLLKARIQQMQANQNYLDQSLLPYLREKLEVLESFTIKDFLSKNFDLPYGMDNLGNVDKDEILNEINSNIRIINEKKAKTRKWGSSDLKLELQLKNEFNENKSSIKKLQEFFKGLWKRLKRKPKGEESDKAKESEEERLKKKAEKFLENLSIPEGSTKIKEVHKQLKELTEDWNLLGTSVNSFFVLRTVVEAQEKLDQLRGVQGDQLHINPLDKTSIETINDALRLLTGEIYPYYKDRLDLLREANEQVTPKTQKLFEATKKARKSLARSMSRRISRARAGSMFSQQSAGGRKSRGYSIGSILSSVFGGASGRESRSGTISEYRDFDADDNVSLGHGNYYRDFTTGNQSPSSLTGSLSGSGKKENGKRRSRRISRHGG